MDFELYKVRRRDREVEVVFRVVGSFIDDQFLCYKFDIEYEGFGLFESSVIKQVDDHFTLTLTGNETDFFSCSLKRDVKTMKKQIKKALEDARAVIEVLKQIGNDNMTISIIRERL